MIKETGIEDKPSSLKFWIIIAGIFYTFGIFYVTYFFNYTKKLRTLSDTDKEKKYGAFANEPEKWNKFVFYLFSVFILPRLVTYILLCAILAFSIRILMIHADKSKPISGWRKIIVRFLGQTITRSGLFVQSFMWIRHKNDIVDYSKWLGPDYKTQKIERPPIIISNHMSWSDILCAMSSKEFPAFVSSSFVRDYPFVGSIAQAIGSVFVDRGDSNSRSNALQAIKDRVESFKADVRYPQLWIFPEGCTTNGKYLLKFKRGAFETEDPILPIYIEYYSPFCNVSFDSLPSLLHFLLIGCQPFSLITLHRLPVVFPTKYMFEQYKHLGNSNWEIYAEVVREIYCATYGLKKSNLTLVDKKNLEDYLYNPSKMKLDQIHLIH